MIARSDDAAKRMALARSLRTHQEILYYMAEHDPDPMIRQVVAQNLATPIQASGVISSDANEDVRLALAERLVKLLPDLSREDYSQLYAVAVQALNTLARDEVIKIRSALSSALRDHAYAPPSVVAQLARDVERQVAEPIIRFCAALEDKVLLDILRETPEKWILEAIASRKKVSHDISAAVISHNDASSGRTLIYNPGADMGLDLLRDIVERARFMPEWQEPLAIRKGLPPEVSKILAGYAQESVRHILAQRGGFNKRMTDEVSKVVKRRLSHAVESETSKDRNHEKPYDRAVRLARAGTLDEKIISDALALHEEEFVIAALACLAGASIPVVKHILSLKAAKPIVTLSWRAGLSMRMALQLQKEMGRVPFKELIYPRDGTDYPLSLDELNWQLNFLGLKAA